MSQEGFDKLKKDCINSGLCVECGACAVVCPNNAIELKQYPWGRNPELVAACDSGECELCSNVCPGKEIPISAIEQRFFGRQRNMDTYEKDLGVIKSVHVGFAKDQEVREHAVSGGIISSTIIYALENDIIDGAVLAHYDSEKPWNAKAYVATNREEVLKCAGSKYQPHPQVLGIKEAYDRGLKRIAVTSTPCHAIALRKMMMKEEFSKYGSIIKLVLSNICAAHWSLHGTEWLITKQLGLKLEDVSGINYRARPFPGTFRVWLKDGSIVDAPFVNSFLAKLPQFTPEECRLCLEKVGYAADIVLGDTWHHPTLCPNLLRTYDDEKVANDERIGEALKGSTAVIVRSDLGQQIVNDCVNKGYVKLYENSSEEAETFLTTIHSEGKPVNNGPVVQARIRRGMPVKRYF